MATTYSAEMLAGACMAHGLDGTGTAEELHARLGAHLVAKLLSPHVPKRKRKAEGGTSTPKRSAGEWRAFAKAERPKVMASGFTGRAETIQEIARRWKIFKSVGTSTAPLALPAPSSSDSDSDGSAPEQGLLELLAQELNPTELNAALAAHGLPIDGSDDEKLKALGTAMMA